MGKNFRRGGNKKNFGKRPQVKDRNDKNWTPTERENAKWEKYYKDLEIIPEAEWETFKTTCQEVLPLTFRITGSRSHADEIKQNFIQKHYSNLTNVEFEGVKLAAPQSLPWYPDELAWQLDASKTAIRKNEEFAKTQRFLVMETEVGNISRQEAVSMIPPLLLDVQPHHHVLDMCAAPGSKTAQLVEALHSNDTEKPATGFVMANDSDYKRSHMLVHQVKRLNSGNFMVVNHDAQLFPRIKLNGASEFLKYDRILCDVPCAGDGTMRKNITVWKDWTPGNALGLHPLQINILNRGLQLLRKGGRLVYSTCSMSPVENEAVVAAALRKWGSAIRLVNCDKELAGLKRVKGMNSWKVVGKDMEPREPGAADILKSVFPPTEEEAKVFGLENCIRIYPHLQNTGGFFITVFEKIDPEAGRKKREAAEQVEEASKKLKTETGEAVTVTESEEVKEEAKDEKDFVPQKKEKLPRDANEEPFIFLESDQEQLANCWKFYEFNSEFPKSSCLVRNASGEPLRTIYYVAPIVREILTANEAKLKVIHSGIKLFVSQRQDSGDCPWRIQNESLHLIKTFIGGARKVDCQISTLLRLCKEAFPKIQALADEKIDEAFTTKLTNMSEGCVFLTIKREEGLEDLFLPLWRGKTNINLMVSKKDTHELLYRVFNIETSKDEVCKEEKHKEALREGSQGVVTGDEKTEDEKTAEVESVDTQTPEVEQTN